MKNLDFNETRIEGGFWAFYEKLNRESVIKSVYHRYCETGRFDALKCGWREGMENRPHIFWDSDVMKWIEGASYILSKYPSDELEAVIDGMVEDIVKNQREDGYFNSYFLTVEKGREYTDRAAHELYCTGHAVEAAIAYSKATGKDKFLKSVLRSVEYIYRVFYEEGSAAFVTPGHEEIELALLKLYEYTCDEKHLKLAGFFLDKRGNNDREEKMVYDQSDRPVREIREASGHAVRALYLYTAMAEYARITGDCDMLSACERVFEDIVNTKMSITGGVGADNFEERFSYKYDLPNLGNYNETCAAIALSMFAGAMQKTRPDAKYGDVIERIYYNGFISGVSLDGERFFYSNPLEVDCKKYARSSYLTRCERAKNFDCSCCPPNILRMLATLPRYAYTLDGDTVYCNQFIDGETALTVNGMPAALKVKTDYPKSGTIKFSYSGEPVTMYVRIPDWCIEYTGEKEANGYARFELKNGDSFTLELPMEVHLMEADPRVQDNSGRVAVQRGPVVYCMEGHDNGENLRDVTLLNECGFTVKNEEGIPAPVIYAKACRRPLFPTLYRIRTDETGMTEFCARLIPYFAFANRTASDMMIWTMVQRY